MGLREQIVERLRDDLLSGRLSEGERLVEQDLVDRFGVSRTPVREAIAQLSHEGLLEALPHRSVRVAPTPPDTIRELILPIRATLESFALSAIFDTLTEEDFCHWDEILARLEAACRRGDWAETVNCDIAFHRSIIRRTGQKDLEAIWSAIVIRVRSHFWKSHREYQDLLDLYREHKRIVDVFRQGDKQAAIDVLVGSMA
ncbi:MAG: GntR family transcriptional regulator [Planctomycetota bacterium]|nr:MAG: GntR family transcriptional regulator [Planctomycetota bacterium]